MNVELLCWLREGDECGAMNGQCIGIRAKKASAVKLPVLDTR